MAKEKVTFDYDADADVLYATVGSPKECTYDAMGGGVYIRRDSTTKQFTGFMILKYLKQLGLGKKFSIPHFEHVGIPSADELRQQSN